MSSANDTVTTTSPAANAHSHSHTDDHSHAHTPTHLDANRAHYNLTAEQYDKLEHTSELAEKSAAAMLKAYPFDPEQTSVMEYACGTGLVSRALAPHAKFILGVDISEGMVEQYNKRVFNQGISSDEMRAVCVELKGEEGELDGMKFEVIVCSQSYHHFTSIVDVTRILAHFLKPGGVLLVVDLMKTADSSVFHEGRPGAEHLKHTVAHRGGFTEDEIKHAFDSAGLVEWDFTKAYERERKGRMFALFIARGRKVAS